MAFAEFSPRLQAIELLQRSLRRLRLAHAYLFAGDHLDALEPLALALAKTLNCTAPGSAGTSSPRDDSCDRCPSCRRIDHLNHPDVLWVRPESKLRVITIDQIRDVMHAVNLKPAEARWKVAVIVGADRMNVQASNAFLKTLEEPPPRSILILLSTEPQRLLETILSRCLRLNVTSETSRSPGPELGQWLTGFSAALAVPQPGLLNRYRLLSSLLARLGEIRAKVDQELTARSPLQKLTDVDPDLRDRWEDELNAAIEAEYRQRRSELLGLLHAWFRDVWVCAHNLSRDLVCLPELAENAAAVAARINATKALENLQILERTRRLLDTNVQEALTLEVGLLHLNL